jgi:NitT/TauT family transport system substrate-binding protein
MHTRRSALLAIGCALAAAPRRARATASRVRIGTAYSAPMLASYQLPTMLRQTHGIDAEIVVIPNLVDRMRAIGTSGIDIAYGGINAAISVASQGHPLQLLARASDGGWSMVAAPAIDDFRRLRGRRIGVQPFSVAHVCLLWKLAHERLTDLVEVVVMDNQSMPDALANGTIDAAMAAEPYASLAVERNVARPIWSGYDTPSGRVNNGLVVSPALIAQDTSLARAVLQAHQTATEQLARDNSAAVEATVASLNVPESTARAGLATLSFSAMCDDGYHRAVQALGQEMANARMVAGMPDWSVFLGAGQALAN